MKKLYFFNKLNNIIINFTPEKCHEKYHFQTKTN